MILLKEFDSLIDAESLSERLRSAGVLTHISGKHANHLGPAVTGPIKVGVWVVLDHQVQDAEALLINSEHHVAQPLTEEEMVMLEAQGKHAIGKLGIYAALAVLGIIGFVAFIFIRLSSSQHLTMAPDFF